MNHKKSKYWIIAIIVLVLVFAFVLMNKESFYNRTKTDSNYVSVETKADESCLQCHINPKGYSKYHNPELIGCTSCHLGNATTLDKDDSHKGMVLIPGNLSDASETCGKCHPNELKKIKNSLMTTNSGLVAVDKYIFEEADSPDYQYHIKEIQNSASDKHLRDFVCELPFRSREKRVWGNHTIE